MKYKLIKDNDKFRLLNSPQFIYSNASSKTIKTATGLIRTKILTDGKIKSVTDSDSKEFNLPKDLESIAIFLESKDLELINHNYVIKVLTQVECRNLNNREALFEVIKDIEVYIKNKKDKEALRNIKKTLNLIYGLKDRPNDQDISYEKTDHNVYQLVK